MHAVRIDEILLRRGGIGMARVIAPNIPAHQENALGRPFGFICVNIPRTPQLETIISETETVIENAYTHGTLRSGQTPEQFFEETIAKIRSTIADAIAKERIRIDPSLMIIALACVNGTDIFMTRHGGAFAYLIRRSNDRPTKTIDIFRGFDDDTDERLLNDLVVGAISENDVLLMATGSLFEILPIADIVESTNDSEAPAVAARIRSMILSSPGNNSVAGCLARLAAVRPMFRAKENSSVTSLRSREEEVARTLSPSGLPTMGAWLEKIKSKPKSPANRLPNKTQKINGPKVSILEKFNRLPIAAKRAAIVGLALLAVFFVSLKIISINNARVMAKEKFNTAIANIKKQIDLAESTAIYDESRGRAILAAAETAKKELFSSDKNQAAALSGLESQINAANRKLQHLYNASIKTIETTGAPGSFALKTGSGWLTNSGSDLILLDANGSPTTIATLPAAPVWAAVSGDTDGAVYLWLKNGTLVTIAAAPKSLPRVLDYSGPANPRAGALWGGRLYILAEDGKEIWKLPPTLTGFGRGSTWLAVPLSASANSISIDGSIYTAVLADAVRRFEKGKMSPFAAAGATANTDPVSLVLGSTNIYALGNDNSIAIWEKATGKLLAQYAIPISEGKATAFAVDETAKTIIFTTDKGVISSFALTTN
jgi:hypothetical protein